VVFDCGGHREFSFLVLDRLILIRSMEFAVQILGLRFFDGEVNEVVDLISTQGGVLVVPAAPALVRLQRDPIYRDAITRADVAIPDSGLMVLVWTFVGNKKLRRISGLTYLQTLIRKPEFKPRGRSFFVLPSDEARDKLLGWAGRENRTIQAEDCYVAPHYDLAVQDPRLLEIVRSRRPTHVIIAIGNGPQEKLGVYLRDNLPYRPSIHCIGAALGFLTGDQIAIPQWADHLYLGWIFRLVAQPRIFIPRLARASILPWLIVRYGSELPPVAKSRK
jgi:UDP-N-acetyl-D-mannosaminuronic acid transferase (WecB/TagA/CpsF family)